MAMPRLWAANAWQGYGLPRQCHRRQMQAISMSRVVKARAGNASLGNAMGCKCMPRPCQAMHRGCLHRGYQGYVTTMHGLPRHTKIMPRATTDYNVPWGHNGLPSQCQRQCYGPACQGHAMGCQG